MRRILSAPLLRLVGQESGSAAIEAALALPFVIAFAFGIFEFGSIFYRFQQIQTGVRDAARYLARVPDPKTVETVAKDIAVTGSPTGTAPPRVAGWRASMVTVAYRATPNPFDPVTGLRAYRGGDPLLTVTVSTRMENAGLGLLSAFGFGKFPVTSSHSERHVGQ